MHLDQDVQLLGLDLLDYLMIEGKMPLWTQIASKAFLTSLVTLLKTRNAPEVQSRILYLIKKWGVKFENQKEILPNFYEIYKEMKNSGVIFPENEKPNYFNYLGEDNQDNDNYEEQRSNNNYVSDFNNNNYESSSQEEKSSGSIRIDLNPKNFDKKYSPLINKINVWIENIILANEMIDNSKVGRQIDDGLKSVINSLRPAENELILNIQEKVKDEKLLEILLSLNDDFNKTMTRYETLRMKKRPEPFDSSLRRYSKPESSRQNKNNQQKPQVSNNNNLLDMFSNTNSSNSNQNVGSVNNQQQNKPNNDFFDIFNNVPVNNKPVQMQNENLNQVNKNNNSSNNPFGMFNPVNNNNLPQNILISNSVTNSNQNQNDKKGVDLLSEKLKNIYQGKEEPVPMNNMVK